MKVRVLAAALIIILGAGVWWGLQTVKATQNQAQQAPNTTSINNSGSSSPSVAGSESAPLFDTQGGVDVTVTWEKEGSNSSMQKFAVSMSNHMTNLDDFDFTENTELKISGTTVPAVVKVLNKSGEGHHVSAEIGVQSTDLSELKPGSQVTLVIKNLVRVPMRNFTWVY